MKIPVTCERTLVGLPARPKFTPQREAMVAASNDGAFKLKELERAEAWIAEVASHVRLHVLDEHKFSESCKSQERKLAERATLAFDVLELWWCEHGPRAETITFCVLPACAPLSPRISSMIP